MGIVDGVRRRLSHPCEEHLLGQSGGSEKAEDVGRAFMNEFMRQLEQDAPIWANKRYVEKPILCESDGPIAQYRRWAQQFYS